MTSEVNLGGYPEIKIPATAIYSQDPGLRPGQISDFNQMEAGMRVVLVGPGRLAALDYSTTVPHPINPSMTHHPEKISYGADVYAEDLTIAALHARLSGGYSLGFEPHPERYSRLVPDAQSLVAFGVGEGEGGPQGGTSRSLLSFTKADLGMEPYRANDGVLGWSVYYLRHALPGEPRNAAGWARQPLLGQAIIQHIPGTTMMPAVA